MSAAVLGLLAWAIIGGLAGALACRVMSIGPRRWIAIHVMLGVLGATLAGGIVSLMVEAEAGAMAGPSLASLIAALSGAFALLAVAGRFRSGILRA